MAAEPIGGRGARQVPPESACRNVHVVTDCYGHGTPGVSRLHSYDLSPGLRWDTARPDVSRSVRIGRKADRTGGVMREGISVSVNGPLCPRKGCLQRQLPLRGGAPLLDADAHPVSRAYDSRIEPRSATQKPCQQEYQRSCYRRPLPALPGSRAAAVADGRWRQYLPFRARLHIGARG